MKPGTTSIVFALALPLGACADDAESPTDDAVTYRADILPIVTEACGGCHRDGGIAPFAIDDYATAAAWGPAIAAATEARTMPPFAVNNDGSCNTYANARWLSDADIDTIAAWVDGGSPEGDTSIDPPPPHESPRLSGSDIVELHTPPAYQPIAQGIPEAMYDDYQCFLIQNDEGRDRFLTGYDVVPGNDAIVHHVLGFNINPDSISVPDQDGTILTNAERMQLLDDQTPDQPGWDCFAAAGDNVMIQGVPVSWAPGAGAVNFPEDTGIRIATGEVWVIQMHYSLIDASGSDQSTIRLSYADAVESEAHLSLWDEFLYTTVVGDPDLLPAGQESVTYEWSTSLGTVTALGQEGPVEVLGVVPHMHQRGRGMSIEFDVAGQEVCGADVDRWDFNWQQAYFYDQPIAMDLADTIRVTCDWDTRGDSEPVRPGFGTDSEMCLVGLYVAER